MNAAGVTILVIFLLLLAAAAGWVIFTRIRAQKLGLPPPPFSSYIPFYKSSSSPYEPQPAQGGVAGWFSDRIRSFKNRNNRTATGAYEGAPSGGNNPRGGRRGFGPLDPDEAWDSRVGHEADGYGGYYEEQELGLHPSQHSSQQHQGAGYGGDGSSYQMNLASTPAGGATPHNIDDEERGRSRSRHTGGVAPPGGLATERNPFDDNAEPSNMSMRGVSPRPIDPPAGAAGGASRPVGGGGQGQQHKDDDSPTERRSIFREEV